MSSAYTCVETRARAPEMALDVLGGSERAEALEHLGSCAVCRSYLAELTEVVDALPVLIAEADPPAGFERRTLERMGAVESRWHRRVGRTVVALLAALAVGAAASIASVAGVRLAESDPPRAAATVTEARLVGRDGSPLGSVLVPAGSEHVVFVTLDGALPGGAYTLDGRDDSRVWSHVHRFDVGRSAAYFAAPVPDSAWPLRVVRIVDASGSTVARSALHAVGATARAG